SDSAQRFLDKQIKDYEDRLAAEEDALKQFKRKNMGLMPGQGGDYYQNLQAAIGDLEQSRLQLQEAQNRRKELKRQLEEAASQPAPSYAATTPATSLTPELDARINNLETRLDELLLKYTDQHPDVIEVKRTIADLKKQRKEVLATQAKSNQGQGNSQADNPYEAQLKLAVSEADANVAALTARVAAGQRKVDHLKKMVNILPAVEEQLKQLNRDYNVTKSNYLSLLQKRESANMSEQMDQNADTVKFRVVDPPFVPPVPSDPNRPLLSSGVLLGSILAGIAFAFLLAQLNPTFDSRRILMEVTNLPVLGGVSMIWTNAQARKKRVHLWWFSFAIIILMGFYSAVMTMQILRINPVARIAGLL
ncbi:MAG: GNVR domain-containing protein, partial [Gammaproteobacteria bacterium]